MSNVDRQELHALLEHIPATDAPAARWISRALMDPLELALLSAALDDEPDSDEEGG
jgi:hypothetical protein